MMERPIILTNSHGVHDKSVSEHTMALLLSWFHRIPEAVRNQDAHQWKRPKGDILYKKKLLIVGFGGIGRAVAEKARVFGMSVGAVKRSRTDELFADEVFSTEDIMTALPAADVILAALPATPDTERFFDEEKIRCHEARRAVHQCGPRLRGGRGRAHRRPPERPPRRCGPRRIQ